MRLCNRRKLGRAPLSIITLSVAGAILCVEATSAQTTGPEHRDTANRADYDAHKDGERPGEREELTLQEIIVTAQKREENLQKTSLAVTAVSGETLEKTGTVDPQGLTDLVPGVEVGYNNSNTTFAIRGISSTTDATLGDAAVAFHLDGVFEGRPSSASGLFYDLQRVEVLRGPQGTLYGRNATAGTVNVVTNRPTFDGYKGEAQVETGSYSELRTEAMFNAPITDTFAIRGAAQTLRHNGYLNTGYNDADDHAARLQALWTPNDDVSLLLFGDYFHQGGVGNGFTQLPFGSDPWHTQTPLITQAAFTSHGGYVSPAGTTDNLSWSIHAVLTWNLGPVVLTEIPAFHHLRVNYFAYGNGVDNSQDDRERETSNELRLASAAGSAVKWVAGLYYHDEEQPYTQIFYDNVPPINDTCCSYLGQGDSLHFIYPKISNPSYAAFGQLTFPVTSSFRVTGGLRWNRDHKRVIGGTYRFFGEDTVDFQGNLHPAGSKQLSIATDADTTWKKVTWKAGVEQDLTDSNLLYANVSTGYKQGGVFAGASPNTYKPESITAYEIGSKNRFLNNRLQINADVFYYKYRDYQVDQLENLPIPGGGFSFGDDIFNAGRFTEYGGEIETRWLVTPADEVDVNVAGLHARFDEFQFPLQGNPGAPGQLQFEDLSGQVPTSAPKWTATVGFQHSWQFSGDSSLEWMVRTHVESSYWLAVDHAFDPNKAGSRQAGYSRTQTAITYFTPQKKVSFQVFVRNIENKAVMNTFSYGGTPPAYASISAPRTFGVAVGAHW
jgi:iron complex outermembrane receptor protein